MESIDQQKAQAVWQRVRGNIPTMDTAALIRLMSRESATAYTCLRLAKRMGGRGGPLLRIARQCRQNAGCLRGICTVLEGAPPKTAVPPLREKPYRSALQECYVNSLADLQQFEAFSQDPDYGPVFQKMAAATRDRCAVLLELIGKTEG